MALGNPAPFGLLAFGMTTCLLMYVEMGWVESEFTELVAGYAFFYGGLAQLLAAIFELIKGSSFSFAVFGSYGAFWMGWAFVLVQDHSTTSDFGEHSGYQSGKTAWLIQWGVLTTCFFAISLRKNICLITVLGLLALTFYLLAGAEGSGSDEVQKAAGYFGFFTALAAWYTGIAELVNEEVGQHLLPGLKPIVSPEKFKITKESIVKRTSYDSKSNTIFLQFRGMQIKSEQDVLAIKLGVEEAIKAANAPDSKVHVVADYENVLISDDIFPKYWQMVSELESNYYLSARRFHVSSFGTGTAGGGASSMRKFKKARQVMENSESLEAGKPLSWRQETAK